MTTIIFIGKCFIGGEEGGEELAWFFLLFFRERFLDFLLILKPP
jgi:hypothetical protein